MEGLDDADWVILRASWENGTVRDGVDGLIGSRTAQAGARGSGKVVGELPTVPLACLQEVGICEQALVS